MEKGEAETHTSNKKKGKIWMKNNSRTRIPTTSISTGQEAPPQFPGIT